MMLMGEPSILVTKQRNRKPRWRLKGEASGAQQFVKPGRVSLPPTVEENRRVRDAVDRVLTDMARQQRETAEA